MSQCTVTLSANAGAAIQLGGRRIWSDALHRDRVPGFSILTPAQQEALWRHPDFSAPDLLFYTHCHPDHYSRELTNRALAAWPDAMPILPRRDFERQVLLTGQRARLSLDGVTLRFRRLRHEGPQYAAVPHYGCMLESGGFRVLIAGDCAPADPEVAELTGGGPVELALLNFPWLTLERGRAFLRQVIRPAHLLICHLPFAADDRWGYRQAAARSAAALPEVPDIRLLLEPFQRERI
jgi:L-ascorbate metabolism protein UlaG (beta-lactamase superfamily)